MSFQASKNLGQLGEMLFYQAHAGDLTRIDGLTGDFKLTETGQKLELKTDTWQMEKTANFFFEHYSDKDKKTPGGPWQSLAHGCDYFVYLYVSNLTYFTFDTKKLVGALEEIIPGLQPFDVRNTSWTTQGYRVPRALVEHLAQPHTLEIRPRKLGRAK